MLYIYIIRYITIYILMPTINSVSSGVVNVDRKVPKYIQISEFFVGIKISTMALGEHPQF